MATSIKKGLTAKQLLYMARVFWKKTASLSLVKISSFSKKVDKKTGNLQITCTTYSLKDGNGVSKRPRDIKRHKTSISSQTGPGGKVSTGPIKVSCSCESFLYHCEYKLWKNYGAADLIYGNGRPIVKGPTADVKMAACKHLVTVVETILKKGL